MVRRSKSGPQRVRATSKALRLVGLAALGCWAGGCNSSVAEPGSGLEARDGSAASEEDGAADAATQEDGPGGPREASADVGDDADVYRQVFDAVDETRLIAELEDATGGSPVTVNGATLTLSERWSPAGKANFRAFFQQYFTALGATVDVTTFPENILPGEALGHDIEAVLPGQSADSVVIIVHYDSVGITGQETKNPAVDDDGSGIAMLLEAGRIFSRIPNRKNTVRFVAADYEEISNNLDGDYAYVKYLQQEAATKGFKILVASDDDQTGWSCWNEDVTLCAPQPGMPAYNGPADGTFALITCSGDSLGYKYPDLAAGFTAVATAYATSVQPTAYCDGSGDTDHYAFWAAGIPAYVIEEWAAGNNPHYDGTGNDTFDKIDKDYLFHIAQIQITYQAKLMGITGQ